MADLIGGFSATTSCMAAVLDCGNPNNIQTLIVGYIGGYSDGKDWNLWWEEIENSTYIEDIFGSDTPPSNPGFYVWEGEASPVFDDAPDFYGKWRVATPEDFVKFQRATE